MREELLRADCLEVLPGLRGLDSCVTDPPYELGFMGRAWDSAGVSFQASTWRAVLEALKPGAHLLAFGGTRTHHRLACAVEDAGFEIRDTVLWLYGTGFPKSHDVSKAIDKAAGAAREVIGDKLDRPGYHLHPGGRGGAAFGAGVASHTLEERVRASQLTAPATEAARAWQGWGTGLKPAWEPILVARRPLEGTVAANVLAHGTGALNVDGCRVHGDAEEMRGRSGTSAIPGGATTSYRAHNPDGGIWEPHAVGRWPANVVHDGGDEVLEAFGVFGESKDGTAVRRHLPEVPAVTYRASSYAITKGRGPDVCYGGRGTPERFFYCAKASPAERGRGNDHPTVKPLALLRWIVRLVTPPGGVVLDPFAGSGSTLLAARAEGFGFVGVELEERSHEIATARLAAVPGRLPGL
jgi:site-specific DNA-methyltransferase (adenine-specific)